MKLRNKKTGEVFTICNIVNDKGEKVFGFDIVLDGYELINVPLIKDEKIRKAVRAWSEANCIDDNDKVLFRKFADYDFVEFEFNYKMSIRFYLTTIDRMEYLEDKTYYTITELCGESDDA